MGREVDDTYPGAVSDREVRGRGPTPPWCPSSGRARTVHSRRRRFDRCPNYRWFFRRGLHWRYVREPDWSRLGSQRRLGRCFAGVPSEPAPTQAEPPVTH